MTEEHSRCLKQFHNSVGRMHANNGQNQQTSRFFRRKKSKQFHSNFYLVVVGDLFKLLLTGKIFKELTTVKTRVNAHTNNWRKSFVSEKAHQAKISVVVPTFNESGHIKNLILSLKASPYKNYDIIVVDGMSQDDTVEEAKKLGAKVVLSKKRNTGYQTHLGFISATGEIIVRTDADTIFPQDTLANIANIFDKEEVAVYHVGRLYYDGSLLLNLISHLYDKYWRRLWSTKGCFIAVRKNVYKKVFFKPLAKGQDREFGKRAYEVLGKEAFLLDPSRAVLTSARAVRKYGLIQFLLYQGSFQPR